MGLYGSENNHIKHHIYWNEIYRLIKLSKNWFSCENCILKNGNYVKLSPYLKLYKVQFRALLLMYLTIIIFILRILIMIFYSWARFKIKSTRYESRKRYKIKNYKNGLVVVNNNAFSRRWFNYRSRNEFHLQSWRFKW